LRRWRAEVEGGRAPREVLEGARPRPHFSRKAALEQQLRLWSDAALALAAERLHLATAESRKSYGRAETIMRRVFLALAQMAAQP
jgi:DNA polymerase-3 subunit delta